MTVNSRSKPDLEITGSSPRKDWRTKETRQRTHLVGVRLSPAESALLRAEAKRTGLTMATVLREAFLASVKAGITPGPPRSDR